MDTQLSIAPCKSKRANDKEFGYQLRACSYAYAMVMLHFVKRELETILYVPLLSLYFLCPEPRVRSIHRFSHGTMPMMNLFKK